MHLIDFFRLVPKKGKIKINRKKGIILNNPSGFKRYIFYISDIIFLVGLGGLVYIYIPVGKAWISYKNISPIIQNGYLNIATSVPKEEFRLSIPKILAEANVIANVDLTDKKTFDKILDQNNVALSTGSARPTDGNGSSMYIFAHSTTQNILGARQNAVFYLLDELETNDEIYIFYNGVKYSYRIFDKMVVSSKETSYIDYKDENKQIMILQTCWPVGTNWKRLLVLAEKI